MNLFAEFPQAKKLDVKEIVNVLHEAKFPDGDWEQLGQQLIDCASLKTISANRHGNSSLCMIDTISQWLRTDSEPSWEKLAEAIAKVGGYGEPTADIVREKAGIIHTGMFCLMSVFVKCSFIKRLKSHIFLTVAAKAISWEGSVSSQLSSTVGTHGEPHGVSPIVPMISQNLCSTAKKSYHMICTCTFHCLQHSDICHPSCWYTHNGPEK